MLIHPCGWIPLNPLGGTSVTLGISAAQGQAFFVIESIGQLVIDLVTFPTKQNVEPLVTVSDSSCGEISESNSDFGPILGMFATSDVVVVGSFDSMQAFSAANGTHLWTTKEYGSLLGLNSGLCVSTDVCWVSTNGKEPGTLLELNITTGNATQHYAVAGALLNNGNAYGH